MRVSSLVPPYETRPGNDGTSATKIPYSSCSITTEYFMLFDYGFGVVITLALGNGSRILSSPGRTRKDPSCVGMTVSYLLWLIAILNDLALSGGFDVLRFDAPRPADRLSGECQRLNATYTHITSRAACPRSRHQLVDRKEIHMPPPGNEGVLDCSIGMGLVNFESLTGAAGPHGSHRRNDPRAPQTHQQEVPPWPANVPCRS